MLQACCCIPESSCTESLQTWHVSSTIVKNEVMTGAVLFEDLLFENADYDKGKHGRNRLFVRAKRDHNSCPTFSLDVTKTYIQRLHDHSSNGVKFQQKCINQNIQIFINLFSNTVYIN